MQNDTTQLAVRAPNAALTLMPTTPEAAFKFAEFLAKASLMPAHLKDKPADCFLILMRATEWNMNPLAVAEKTSVINGKLMYEGQLVAALINTRLPLEEPLDYQFEGQGNTRVLHVIGKCANWKAPREIVLAFAQAVAINRNGQMQKNPDQQMCYIGARLWARRFCPEVLLGVYASDEMPGEGQDDDTPTPAPERAKLPPKNKGAAAMKTVTELAPAAGPETAVSEVSTEEKPAGAKEADKPVARPEPDQAALLRSAQQHVEREMAAKGPATPTHPAVPQPEGWPKRIEGAIKSQKEVEMTVEAAQAARAGGDGLIPAIPAKKLPTILLEMDSPEAVDAGLEVEAKGRKLVTFLLNPYTVETLPGVAPHPQDPGEPRWDEMPKGPHVFTLEQWPSLTQPGKTLNVVVAIQPVVAGKEVV